MKSSFFKLFFFFLVAINQSLFANISEWQIDDVSKAKTRILGSSIIENDKKVLLFGVEFELQDGWKIYGQDSQDIGLPPSFDFKGSKNYKEHKIQWPQAHAAEEKIGDTTYHYNYYTKNVVIPIVIHYKNLKKPSEISLNLNYGICKDICVPVSQSFKLSIADIPDCEAVGTIRKFQTLNKSESEAEFQQIDLSLPQNNPEIPHGEQKNLLTMLLIAIIGGAILNIMPCVLPVLSIKLLSILNHSQTKKEKLRLSFLATILGIIACFLVLALFTFSLKQAGNSLGWGFQFQNPVYLIFLILILTFFVADLIGFFEINFSEFLASALNKKISKNESRGRIFIPNFLSGILAVMLATPCSAPFLGSAISFALTQNFAVILLIFMAIGCGFALPYFALILSPKLLHLLPKPGNWMNKAKQLMAGFLTATIIWLVWVLSAIIGFLPAILVAVFASLMFLAMKLKSRIFRLIALAIIFALAFFVPFKVHHQEINNEKQFARYWQGFDENLLASLVAQNRVVLVDVTADWCLTCKFNKMLVLQSKEIVQMLESGEIVGLRADITGPDAEAMKFLKKHNRFAIPFNAVYGPKLPQGQAASELLNKEALIKLIEQAK